MGRLYVVLDSSGYKYGEEPGFCWRITGGELFKRYLAVKETGGVSSQQFFCPPTQLGDGTSEWVMSMPRHWYHPRWYSHAALVDYVIRKVRWTFATGVTASEFEPTRTAQGVTYPDNQFIAIPSIAAGADVMDAGLTALFTAAGVTKPTNIRVAGFTDKLPNGNQFDEEAPGNRHYFPYFQFVMFPDPSELICFGFNDIGIIITRGNCYVLRDGGFAYSDWSLAGKFGLGKETGSVTAPDAALGVAARLTSTGDTVRAQTLLFTAIHGIEHIHIYVGGARFSLPIDLALSGSLTEARRWWVASYPNGRLAFQCQVVGYETAEYTPPESGGVLLQPMFDLGQAYMPTVDPVTRLADALVYYDAKDTDGDGTPDNPATTSDLSGFGKLFTSSLGGEVRFRIVDETGADWVSDGTHQKGALYIKLKPSTDTFLPSILREIQVKFPVKLTNRAFTTLTLNDTQYVDFEVSTSLADPGGKRVRVRLSQDGAALFEATDLAFLDGYPIHIEEDTTGDGNPDTARARGWVEAPDLVDYRLSPDVYVHTVEAAGLLKRMDRPPLYLPQALDPTTGKLESRAAIMEALRQCGFDETSAWISLLADPFAGNEIAQLPGQQAGSGEDGMSANEAWQLGWDETWLGYCSDVAQQWRGWSFYETLAEIRYHPELMIELLMGRQYYVAATIYPSHAAATAAGAPRQCYQHSPRRTFESPKANVIRVTGKDASGKDTFHLLDRDSLSVTDPTYEHYLGEWRPATVMSKYAVSRTQAAVVARILLLRHSLRRMMRTVVVKDKPPWEFVGAGGGTITLQVGQVVTLSGMANYLITNLTARGWHGQGAAGSRNNVETEITGVKIPDSVTAAASAGEYPGVGG